MATISSIGIGSGLDVNSIVSKLVDLEKQPLTGLRVKAVNFTAELSIYGTIKSQVSALNDVALSLGTAALWNPLAVSSSNSAAVTASATGVPSKASYSLEVQQLARVQSVASDSVAAGTAMGTGSLTLQLGTWSSNFGAFTAGAAPAVTVTIGVGEDSLTGIASKINNANAGVTATVLTDSSGQRLSIRSNSTGATSGFRVQVADDDATNNDNAGLSRLAFDPATAASGMATNLSTAQQARDANATLNGVPVTSNTNTFANLVPGLSFQVAQVTTAPVTVSVAQDTTAIKKTILDFVAAYNTLNSTLTQATAYNAATKTGSVLQGDATTVGLQNAMRSMIGSVTGGGGISRISDIGITLQRDGSLVAGAKLDTALQDVDAVKNFFTVNNNDPASNGFGLKLKSFTQGLLSFDGTMNNKTAAIQSTIDHNLSDQQKVTDRAAVVEARLRTQYSALDTQMASLSALNNYVTQQVALWNKSST